MVRSFTLAALAAALLAFLAIWGSSLAPGQPGPGPGPVDGLRLEPRTTTFPVPAGPAPPGFYFGAVDWQGWLKDYRSETLLRTGALPDGAIVRAGDVTPTLPILLPADAGVVRNVKLFIEPNSYSASADIDTANVTIYGTHVFRKRAPNDPVARAAAAAPREALSNGLPVRITTAESGINLTFTRWGAAYLISIECESSDEDARCAQPDFIKSLALRMAIAG
jgi:hypothetical protein